MELVSYMDMQDFKICTVGYGFDHVHSAIISHLGQQHRIVCSVCEGMAQRVLVS
jgi:hypothetical protein